MKTKKFEIGLRLYQYYGNGWRYDTIIGIEKYYIILAHEGKISKKHAKNNWNY